MSVETLISIFTIDKGDLKILLLKKTNEPYKNYWVLPNDKVKKDESIENNITNVVIEKVGLSNLWLEQCYTFGNLDRNSDDRIISISYMGLVDTVSIELKMEENNIEKEWFKIDELPKLAFDHDKIISKTLNNLKSKIISSNILKILFPSDFTLPELQNIYEQLLNVKIDRRNFRKKIIGSDLIEETGEYNEGTTGRPAKLYRFKDNVKEKKLF